MDGGGLHHGAARCHEPPEAVALRALPAAAGGCGARADVGDRGEVGADALDEALGLVPDGWLADEPGFGSPDDVRAAYAEVLAARLAQPQAWLTAVEVARADV